VLYFPDPEQSRDPALLFNTFAYELSAKMGRYATRFRWVEAFINEDGGELSLADRAASTPSSRKWPAAMNGWILSGSQRMADGQLVLNINRMDPEPETGWPAPNGATEPWFFHTAGRDGILQNQTEYRVWLGPGR